MALEEKQESVLGRPFYVMERVAGRYLADNPPYHMDGWLTECSPEERGAIWRNAICEIARINRVDWQRSGALQDICGFAPHATPLQAAAGGVRGISSALGRSRRTAPTRNCGPVVSSGCDGINPPGTQPVASVLG